MPRLFGKLRSNERIWKEYAKKTKEKIKKRKKTERKIRRKAERTIGRNRKKQEERIHVLPPACPPVFSLFFAYLERRFKSS